MKNKGFTLVELIAVIVIMGMLLLIVFPATSRLMRSNEEKEYDTYYDLAKEGIELYARSKRDDIGGITGTGCINSSPYVLKLSDLIEQEYVKKFDQEKDVICKTPDEFSSAQLNSLGINTSKSYESIRIENDKGKITVDFSLICYKEGKKKPEYTHLVEKTKACNRYVAEVTDSLVKVIAPGGKNQITSRVDTNSQYYVDKNVNNNYVWYSGMFWRIVSFNTSDKTIKLITDENVSIATYDKSSKNYRASNINLWLNNIFLKGLRNPEKYLLETEWNYTAASTPIAPSRTSTTMSQIGLLNYYEYCKIVNAGNSCNTGAGFLNIGKKFWLLTDYTSGENVWYVDSGTAKNGVVNQFMGVRPTIVLKPNITFISGGNGTQNNPYRLTGDTGANIGSYLNTRYIGEYVKFNNVNFRIIDSEAGYTKLIATEPLNVSDYQFHYFDTKYTNNSYIGEYLTKSWSIGTSDKLMDADFCRTTLTTTSSMTASCPSEDLINLKVAIPKVGDLFTANSNKEYWTLTNSSKDKLYVVEPDGTLKEKGIEERSGIRPVIALMNTVTITGGNGTPTSPYTVQ